MEIVDVTNDNVEEFGVYCVKNKKDPGYKHKLEWFKKEHSRGLRLKIAVDPDGKQLGFIEYTLSEHAWRPVKADNYIFINCMVVFDKKSRSSGLGSSLIQACEEDALSLGKTGVCTMVSDGVWIADKTLFEKNGFEIVDQKDRFELSAKVLKNDDQNISINDWTSNLGNYKGWNIVFANQCPWHIKSVEALCKCAGEFDIWIEVEEITDPKDAQNGPSGYGTFALIKDGKLLADHYISKTRFMNILKKEGDI